MASEREHQRVRLDKWLWAARFYKTRALASAAVSGGKVHRDGQRVKPSHPVRPGDRYQIRRGYELFEVDVTDLAERRGSAADAGRLYLETAESMARRETERERRRLAALARPRSEGRPTKKQRRQIHRFRDPDAS